MQVFTSKSRLLPSKHPYFWRGKWKFVGMSRVLIRPASTSGKRGQTSGQHKPFWRPGTGEGAFKGSSAYENSPKVELGMYQLKHLQEWEWLLWSCGYVGKEERKTIFHQAGGETSELFPWQPASRDLVLSSVIQLYIFGSSVTFCRTPPVLDLIFNSSRPHLPRAAQSTNRQGAFL